MNYSLSDSIFKINFPRDVNKYEIYIFYEWHRIRTISDILIHGDAVRNEPYMNFVINEFKRNGLKFDDELTEEQLNERNKEREKIDIQLKEIRSKEDLEELLEREINTLELPNNIINKLNQLFIHKIYELIEESSYTFISLLEQPELKKLISALDKLGLRFEMKDPTTQLIENKEDFGTDIKQEEIAAEEEKGVVEEEKKESRRTSMNDKIKFLSAFSYYFGHTFIPTKYGRIASWLSNMRNRYKEGKISPTTIEKLESINISWTGLGKGKKEREKQYKLYGIKNILVRDGILITEYLDGSVKTTRDKEFIEILELSSKGELDITKKELPGDVASYEESELEEILEGINVEKQTDTSTAEMQDEQIAAETQEQSSSRYELMSEKIEEMKATRESMEKNNSQKRELIDYYKSLLEQLKKLTEESIELDIAINSILGLDNPEQSSDVIATSERTIDELEEIKEELVTKIAEKQRENERKQLLISQFREIEKSLQELKRESEKLDSELEELFTAKTNKTKKRGEK